MNREEAINVVRNNWPEGRHQLSEALKTLNPELQESEDERIRSALLRGLNSMLANLPTGTFYGEPIKDIIAYLESQKEQKDYRKLYEDIAKSEWFKNAYEGKSLGCDYEQKEQKPSTPEDIAAAYQMGLAEGRKEQKPAELTSMDAIEACMLRYLQSAANRKDDDEIMEDTRKYKQELVGLVQKPAEWSEEDYKMIELLHTCVCRCINDDRFDYAEREQISKRLIPFIERLKSLRPQPHWKPSDAQMQALEFVLEYLIFAKHEDEEHIKSLYNDLKKL